MSRSNTSLIVYGSLAPGESNHHIISHIDGIWRKAKIKGKIIDNGWSKRLVPQELGYPEFKSVPSGKEDILEVLVFMSEQLELYWQDIDEFEGTEDYRRISISCVLDTGDEIIASIYERI